MSHRAFLIVVFLVLGVTCAGIIGYTIIEGWDLHDSIYMTIITLTTTGYQEVHQLSKMGRTFTIILLIVGMGTVGFSISVLMNELLSIDWKSRRRKRMERKLKDLHGHTIVCAYGRMGKVICQQLAKTENQFVVIEQNSKKIEELEKTTYLWLEGDATQDENLLKVGIEKAKVLVSMVDSDADGLYIALAGRSFNPNLYIIVRASDESAKTKILRAGANRVILPIVMTGHKVAQIVLNPEIEDLLEISGAKLQQNQQVQMIEIDIKDRPYLIGKTLQTCGYKREGLIVVGIQKLNKEFVFAPRSDYQFQEDDCLISLCTVKSYQDLKEQHQI